MDNNELNNNINTNTGDQIMMGNNMAPNTNTNQTAQPNSINMNQGINTAIQNNLNNAQMQQPTQTQVVPPVQPVSPVQPVQQVQPVSPTQPVQQAQPVQPTDTTDSIFSDMQPLVNTPGEPINVTTPTQESTIPTQSEQKKKGKGPIIIIILLLLILLGVGGYFAYDKFIAKKELPVVEDTTEVDESTEKKVLYKDESKDIVYALIDEKHEGVIRRIPYINIESKYADEINKELDELTTNNNLEGQVKEHYLEYAVDYQYYVTDEIVSVKFSWETENSMTHSKIYNINQYTGEKATNSDILKKLNIEENDLDEKMVESYKIARPIESLGDDAVQKECYQKDIDLLSKSTIKGMYINNGELYVLFDMSYPAGAGEGEAILNVSSSILIKNPVTFE